MKTKTNYSVAVSLISGLMILSLNANAQVKPAETPSSVVKDTTRRNSVTEEVEVIRSYKPVLADAVKIRRSPNLNDSRPFNPNVTYKLIDKRLELNSAIRELEAQKLVARQNDALQNNYAKIGLGNLGTNLAQLNITTGQDEALQAGFNFNHLGMSGKLNQQKISTQSIGAYGRSIGDAVILEGKISYDRTSTYFYGLDPLNTFTNLNPAQQKFNFFEADGLILNRTNADDETNFNYVAKVNASIFNNAFQASENNVLVSGGLGKDLNKFHIGANGTLDITTSKDSSYSFNNNLFKINPYIQLKNDRFAFTAGINYVNEFGANQRINLFPAVSLNVMLIKNYLTVFGDLGGDVEKARIKNFSDLNPYINQNLDLRNTVTKFDAAGGIRGTFAPNVGFKAMASYQTFANLSYFVNSTSQRQKFDVAYFSGNTNVIGLDAELNISFFNAFHLDSKLQIKQYDNKIEEYAWLRPGFLLNSTASFKLFDKVTLSGDLLFQGETKAKILAQPIIIGPGPLPPHSPDPYKVQNIKAFADISVGANYQYNKKIGAFFRVNNILANEYNRLPYYPNYGINILGGVSYGF
jgi:hypothetical protein